MRYPFTLRNPWICRLRSSKLARNSVWMLVGQGLRLVSRAVYFVLIARTLGASTYGAFVGAVALVAILAPFGGLGAGNIMVRDVARNRNLFGMAWGNALLVSGVSGLTLLGIAVVVARIFLDALPLSLVALVGVADLIACKPLDLSCQAFQAVQRLNRTAQLNVLLSSTRMLAAVVLAGAHSHPTAEIWSIYYLLSTLVSAACATLLCWRELGAPSLQTDHIWKNLREGVYFSISLSSQSIYNDIDKTMLARMASLDAVGLYAAAYRLVDMCFVPLGSVLLAAYSSFFVTGEDGLENSARFAKKLIPHFVGYGLIASAGLFFLAPIVPHILGREYADTVEATRWLAPLPVIKSIHYLLGDALTGAGMQRDRTIAQVVVAALNVLLCVALIPAYSWRGAAWASLASDGLLAAGLWTIVRVLRRRVAPTISVESVRIVQQRPNNMA